MKNLQEVAGYYFFSLGTSYFLIALFVYNKYALPHSQILFNVLDIPFAFIAISYGATSLIVSLEEHNIQSKIAVIAISASAFMLFCAVIAVNILFPDVL